MHTQRTSEENKAIAQTILNQLGGIRLLNTMIGAKNYTFDENLVGFRYMNAERNNSNHIQIHLLPSDLYKLEFWNIRGMKSKVVETIEGVYADNLAEIFQDKTGLTLTMPVIYRK